MKKTLKYIRSKCYKSLRIIKEAIKNTFILILSFRAWHNYFIIRYYLIFSRILKYPCIRILILTKYLMSIIYIHMRVYWNLSKKWAKNLAACANVFICQYTFAKINVKYAIVFPKYAIAIWQRISFFLEWFKLHAASIIIKN